MNKSECRAEALKYTNKSDFKKHSSVAYYTVLGNRLLNQLCSHFTDVSEPISYTYSECLDEALLYDNENEFCEKSPNKYYFSKRKGWLPKIISYVKTVKYGKVLTSRKLEIEIAKYNSVPKTDFKKRGGVKEQVKHTTTDMELVCYEVASMYNTRESFSENSPVIYKYAEKNGILDYICKHMDDKKSHDVEKDIPSDVLTVCYHEALKYKNRDKFRDKKPSMYNYLLKNNMLEYVCGHMDNLKFQK